MSPARIDVPAVGKYVEALLRTISTIMSRIGDAISTCHVLVTNLQTREPRITRMEDDDHDVLKLTSCTDTQALVIPCTHHFSPDKFVKALLYIQKERAIKDHADYAEDIRGLCRSLPYK